MVVALLDPDDHAVAEIRDLELTTPSIVPFCRDSAIWVAGMPIGNAPSDSGVSSAVKVEITASVFDQYGKRSATKTLSTVSTQTGL